ncbi:MAG TPA: beta-N-acetylhexosaminidase [Vicinamibacterales bacterium]|nr:beta-N-acetylhexosaminidase [Vicinamibacterales bacterium]
MLLRELRRHAGRLAIVGFAGHSVPAELRQLAAEFDLGGVIYFARNVVEPRQVAELSREVAALAVDWPLWISVDQEGGRVARLKRPFTEWPPAMTLGRSGSETLAERFAAALAAELVAVGITLDYAPVLDVHTNPKNPVIGDRALAEEAGLAARLGSAVVRGLQQAGVAACGKHFPGHGDTSRDSHEELPIVDHDRRRLDAVELVPFRAAIAAGVATLMTAHVLVPALDDQPASLSAKIVTGLLKQALGFDGVVLSDDLGMKAISASSSLPDATVAAIEAGCDAVLLCNSPIDDQVAALEAVIRAAESGRLSATRIDDALGRQQRVKARFRAPARPRPGLEVVGCAEHQAVAEEMAAFR